MKNNTISLIAMFITSVNALAMKQDDQIINLIALQNNSIQQTTESSFSTIDIGELPTLCVGIIHTLSKQPLYQKDPTNNKSKVLPLRSFEEARIVELINSIAKSPQKPEKLESIGVNLYLPDFKYALQLPLHEKQPAQCSREELTAAYTEVINTISKNWTLSNPEDYPNLVFKKDPSSHILLTKQAEKSKELAILTRFIGSHFFKGAIPSLVETNCYSDVASRPLLYWWIEKDALPYYLVTFNLAFTTK